MKNIQDEINSLLDSAEHTRQRLEQLGASPMVRELVEGATDVLQRAKNAADRQAQNR
jgi:hypothetical protein